MQVFYLGRAPRTKETLPDFLKWSRVTRHPLVFRGLTGSQRTPGFGASQKEKYYQNQIVEETSGLKERGRKFPSLTGWSRMLQKREKVK